MDAGSKARLVVLQGGLVGPGGQASGRPAQRPSLRVIPGGPEGSLLASIEETILAARRMRQEIEERIARQLEELF